MQRRHKRELGPGTVRLEQRPLRRRARPEHPCVHPDEDLRQALAALVMSLAEACQRCLGVPQPGERIFIDPGLEPGMAEVHPRPGHWIDGLEWLDERVV